MKALKVTIETDEGLLFAGTLFNTAADPVATLSQPVFPTLPEATEAPMLAVLPDATEPTAPAASAEAAAPAVVPCPECGSKPGDFRPNSCKNCNN